MSKNEIVLKAKKLDAAPDCDGVVELLREYVLTNKDDLEAVALYQKNLATQAIVDSNMDIDTLFAEDEKSVFDNVPEELVLKLSETLFTHRISDIYLRDHTEEEKEKLVFGCLYRTVSSLGERLDDYQVLKAQFEKFFNILATFGYGKYFYSDLAYIVDWKSKASENILKFLVEKAKLISSTASDEEIYTAYTKDMKEPLCSFEDKPYLSGGRLVIVTIKSEEEKEFWKGYFTLMKKIREEEYENYRKIASDEKHPLYGALLVGEHIHKSYMNALMKKLATSEEVAKMQFATKCDMLNISENDFKAGITSAEQSLNTVKVNPIEQIKTMILKLFGKK